MNAIQRWWKRRELKRQILATHDDLVTVLRHEARFEQQHGEPLMERYSATLERKIAALRAELEKLA